MKSKLAVFFLLCFSARAIAQGIGLKLTGTVRNKDGQALVAATVSLHRQKDSTVVVVAATDRMGRYFVDRPATGNYFLTVTCIGYEGYTAARIETDTVDIV